MAPESPAGRRVARDLVRVAAVALLGLVGGALVGAALTPARSPATLIRKAVPALDNTRGAILLVFRPGDCPAGMRVVRQLNRLARTPHVAVWGVISVDARAMPDWAELVRASPIRFPVVRQHDRYADQLAAGLQVRQSPFLVLLGPGGRVVVAAGPASDRRMLARLDSLPQWLERW